MRWEMSALSSSWFGVDMNFFVNANHNQLLMLQNLIKSIFWRIYIIQLVLQVLKVMAQHQFGCSPLSQVPTVCTTYALWLPVKRIRKDNQSWSSSSKEETKKQQAMRSLGHHSWGEYQWGLCLFQFCGLLVVVSEWNPQGIMWWLLGEPNIFFTRPANQYLLQNNDLVVRMHLLSITLARSPVPTYSLLIKCIASPVSLFSLQCTSVLVTTMS